VVDLKVDLVAKEEAAVHHTAKEEVVAVANVLKVASEDVKAAAVIQVVLEEEETASTV
jgi:hypothetical protein